MYLVITSEVRQQLRRAVDASVRQRINWAAEPRCRDCGIEASQYLDGCKRCWNRRRSKLRRGVQIAA
jgi:hypothetical protein